MSTGETGTATDLGSEKKGVTSDQEQYICIFPLWMSCKALFPSSPAGEGGAAWGFQDYNMWHSHKTYALFYDIKYFILPMTFEGSSIFSSFYFFGTQFFWV
jgi:hypothetical protein